MRIQSNCSETDARTSACHPVRAWSWTDDVVEPRCELEWKLVPRNEALLKAAKGSYELGKASKDAKKGGRGRQGPTLFDISARIQASSRTHLEGQPEREARTSPDADRTP